MATVTFDTHKFIKTLEAAGLSESQAEAISLAVRESHESVDVSTKADLQELGASLRREVTEMKFELLKWVVGIALAQTGLLIGILVKLL